MPSLISRDASPCGPRSFFHILFKAADGLTQALPQLREALRAKDEKRNREDDDNLLSTESKHKLFSLELLEKVTYSVIPAKAGIQKCAKILDSGSRFACPE